MGLFAGFFVLLVREILKDSCLFNAFTIGLHGCCFWLGMPGIALFHLMTHAFFKALMFLGSGSVIHACHHEQDIFKYGGLRRRCPLLPLPFGWGAGDIRVNFLSGYFSKDAILLGAYNENMIILFCSTLGLY